MYQTEWRKSLIRPCLRGMILKGQPFIEIPTAYNQKQIQEILKAVDFHIYSKAIEPLHGETLVIYARLEFDEPFLFSLSFKASSFTYSVGDGLTLWGEIIAEEAKFYRVSLAFAKTEISALSIIFRKIILPIVIPIWLGITFGLPLAVIYLCFYGFVLLIMGLNTIQLSMNAIVKMQNALES